MYYKCLKVNFSCGGSYFDFPDWIKKKKARIYQKNIDNKCFQYVVTAALNYEEIESHPERVSNIKPLINYPSKIDDWRTFEKNNPTIALNVLHTLNILHILHKSPAFISKINSNCEKQIIILRISNE